MNTPRYIMPVIIAAGLHGTLLYFFSDRYPPPSRPGKEPVVVLPDFPPLQMTPEEPAGAEPSTGGADPLLQLPEMPREASQKDFLLPVALDTVAPLKPLTELPRIPKGFGVPGDGPELQGGPPSITNSINLDRPPRIMAQPSPDYPHALRQEGITGSVTVEFVVDTTGRVLSAEAVRSTHRGFVEPAVRAVLRWKFEPGKLNGRPVRFRMAVPIEFNGER
jgi:protein TonB